MRRKKIWYIWEERDPNNTIELKSKNEKDAMYEALEILGWCFGYEKKESRNIKLC